MLFISILSLAALGIAGAAAYFSVYGLANTFHGVFWSVVFMGGSLEFGKLVATSFLYRFWKTSSALLKLALFFLVIALMAITSMGIFGYLSTGYQTDSLPLKQIEQQTKLLDEERLRLIDRKKQIDDQIANLPADYSKSRVKLMKAFKDEQDKTTNRISVLDTQVLELKTKQIQTESHVGPIIYIAKAVGVSPDDATKWLIYLIIFVFDPMAVALTLAVNTAIKQRELERAPENEPSNEYTSYTSTEDVDNDTQFEGDEYLDTDLRIKPGNISEPEIDHNIEWTEPLTQPMPSINKSDYATLDDQPFVYTPPNNDYPDWSKLTKPTEEEEIVSVEESTPPTIGVQPHIEQPVRRIRPYAGVDAHTSIDDLINQFQYYKQKESRGEAMTQDEIWTYQAIKDAIQRQGFSAYI